MRSSIESSVGRHIDALDARALGYRLQQRFERARAFDQAREIGLFSGGLRRPRERLGRPHRRLLRTIERHEHGDERHARRERGPCEPSHRPALPCAARLFVRVQARSELRPRHLRLERRQRAQRLPRQGELLRACGACGALIEMAQPAHIGEAIAHRQQFFGGRVLERHRHHSPRAAMRASGGDVSPASSALVAASVARTCHCGASAARKRACARASCDLEKLTERLRSRAISACV